MYKDEWVAKTVMLTLGIGLSQGKSASGEGGSGTPVSP